MFNLQDSIITKEQQNQLTPDSVIEDLKAGNARFLAQTPIQRDTAKQVDAATSGQSPKAAILSCIDSRVPVEMVFDQSIGDIFVGRVAGNVESENMLGSMEYATKVVGVKVLLVLGHSSCGAVKAAIDDVELGNITGLLSNIKPAVSASEGDDKTSANGTFVQSVVEKNVQLTIDRIREKSPIMKEMEDNGEIKIVGGVYHLSSGKVEFL